MLTRCTIEVKYLQLISNSSPMRTRYCASIVSILRCSRRLSQTAEVSEWMNYYISNKTMGFITYPFLVLAPMSVIVILYSHIHDDVIKWKHFPRYWPFVREIHRSPVNFPHKGQWRGALIFRLICAWINDWISNREAGYLRRYRAHYDVTLMLF